MATLNQITQDLLAISKGDVGVFSRAADEFARDVSQAPQRGSADLQSVSKVKTQAETPEGRQEEGGGMTRSSS
jgi:hypothetical protein